MCRKFQDPQRVFYVSNNTYQQIEKGWYLKVVQMEYHSACCCEDLMIQFFLLMIVPFCFITTRLLLFDGNTSQTVIADVCVYAGIYLSANTLGRPISTPPSSLFFGCSSCFATTTNNNQSNQSINPKCSVGCCCLLAPFMEDIL